MKLSFLNIALCALLISCGQQQQAPATAAPADTAAPMAAASPEMPPINTPEDALAALKAGNQRFLDGKMMHRDYKAEIDKTKADQKPPTVVLSCMDSRVPPEVLFDQGLGDLFVNRVAGNIEDPNMLGSLEYATKVVGSKLIVVIGHSHCGAVKGAIDNAQLGNLTQLLAQIKPAIVKDADKEKMIEATAKNNVKMNIDAILKGSPVVAEMVKNGAVKIVGAYYDIETGKVSFMQ